MITSIYQEVELSLTENLIPVTVPVKQYDNRARKVRCVLYNNSVQYSVPQDCIVACSGTRPDGTIFHYTSETASDLVFVENGAVVFTITTFMTAQAGRFPLDVVIPDNCSEAREGRSGVMEGDRTLPGVVFVAASGRAFFVFKVLLCCYFACFFVWPFLPVRIAMCRILLYVVGGEKYTYDRKYT